MHIRIFKAFPLAILTTLIVSVAFFSHTTFAQGEAYKWSGPTTVDASGGIWSGTTKLVKSGTGWIVSGTSTIQVNGTKCQVNGNDASLFSPVFTVDTSKNTIAFNGQTVGNTGSCTSGWINSLDKSSTISGSPNTSTPPGTNPSPVAQSCTGLYGGKPDLLQACTLGFKAYGNSSFGNDLKKVEDYCNKGGDQLENASRKAACVAGAKIADINTNITSYFGTARDKICAAFQGGEKSSCQSAFETALQNCLDSNPEITDLNSKLDATKKCLVNNSNYASSAAIINAVALPQVTDGQTPPTNTCNIDGIGWIVCPVVNFLSGIVDASYSIVSSLLTTPALNTDTGSSANGAYKAWSAMRSFANVVFVIGFIFIIYSQLTGAGISNYGIKKMLPKIIIAAILVNVSYWICAIAVDLSNILGSSLKGLLDGITASLPANSASAWSTGSNVFAGIAATLLVAGTAMYIGLAVFLPILITVLFAIVTVLIVLILRQALIILLIVISPLAFVAFLLPNTEGYFKKWRQLFQTLLLMFPIIAVIFGASTLASKIVTISVAGADTGEAQKIMTQIVAAGIAIIPLFITPIVMKTAGGLLSRFGGIVNNPAKGPFDRMKKGADRIRENQQNKRAIRSMNGGRVFGGGQFRRQAKRGAIDTSLKRERSNKEQQYVAEEAVRKNKEGEVTGATRFGKQLAGGWGADATAIQSALANAQFTIDEATAKEIKAESVMVRDMDAGQLKNILKDPKASETRQAAAMQRLVKVSDAGDYEGEINTAINSDSSVLRRAAAEALGADGPGFVKASDVDRIASGAMKKENEENRSKGREETSLATIARNNTAAGVMSAEKIVGETSGNIKYAFDHSEDGPDGGKQRLVNASYEAQTNDLLKGKIKHNIAAIGALTDKTKHIARTTPIVYTKTDSNGAVTTTTSSTELKVS